jgi:hypothetical protein
VPATHVEIIDGDFWDFMNASPGDPEPAMDEDTVARVRLITGATTAAARKMLSLAGQRIRFTQPLRKEEEKLSLSFDQDRPGEDGQPMFGKQTDRALHVMYRRHITEKEYDTAMTRVREEYKMGAWRKENIARQNRELKELLETRDAAIARRREVEETTRGPAVEEAENRPSASATDAAAESSLSIHELPNSTQTSA